MHLQTIFRAFIITIGCASLFAQSSQIGQSQPALPQGSADQAQPGSAANGPAEDRFPALRESADRLKQAYVDADAKNMAQVDTLMRTRRCQINRINGLLDRTLEAMHNWQQAELAYWTSWGDAEQQRVESQKKSLASIEADQQRVRDSIDTETKDHDELLRKRAALEKYGKRTEEIIKDIDSLVVDIKESEDRLAKAQKDYDDVSTKVANMNASIMARLIGIRQNRDRAEAYVLQYTTFYEGKRKDAGEICSTKQPDDRGVSLPQRKPQQ